MESPSVFISYSQDSDEHKEKVLQLANRLRDDGVDANLDQYQTNPPEGWQLWMEKQIRDSQFVILVCTETYLRRVMKEDDGRGKGVMWESGIIYSYLYEAGVVNEKFIPVVFGIENTKYIPVPLKPTTFYDLSTEDGYEALYRRLTNQPYTTKRKLGKLKSLPARPVVGATHASPLHVPQPLPPEKISLAKLPSTSPDLFGRENELALLDAAWDSPNVMLSKAKHLPDGVETLRRKAAQGDMKVNIFTLVAFGGVGKSALVNKWLLQMARDNYHGAERVFGWSFYSQGAAEGRQVSADQFIATALEWFGDPNPNEGSAWDKGERLAELIKGQRTLLILDGLEPLQSPPPVETGKIKDPALVSLLRELARQNPGLVVISTRLTVDDLKDCVGDTVIERDLDTLSDEAGAEYLSHLGVDGTEEERKAAAHDFGGHALALTLLGRYLADIYDGDIRRRKEIPHLTDEEEKGGHAKRVMKAYETWFEGKPELDLLKLMGLFDRPAIKGALEALLAPPVIEGLTEHIQGLPPEKYKLVLKHLRKARLIANSSFDFVSPTGTSQDELDCHPLLREYFGEQLQATNPTAWKEANSRLYEYYKTTAKELPNTLQEMAPLFAAVMHGCAAGKHQETYDKVYRKRIRRDDENYQVKKLGAIGTDLATISGFFDGASWRKPVDGLRVDAKGWLLNTAGYHLRALGQLTEAAQPMLGALELDIAEENWVGSAADASNLSELYLTIGDVKQALDYAEQSVELADKSGENEYKVQSNTHLAYALHQSGNIPKAMDMFQKAEEFQKQFIPQAPFLILYLSGFYYCDLLLEQKKYDEVQLRATQTLGIVQKIGNLLAIALDNLSLGRALAMQTSEVFAKRTSEVLTHLNRAVDGLRQAGTQHELPKGLLARAEYYRVVGDFEKAKRDLDEAFAISTRGGMGLHLADCHLGYARLKIRAERSRSAEGKTTDDGQQTMNEAREHLRIAKEMIDRMGYHRRDKEVEELRAQIGDG